MNLLVKLGREGVVRISTSKTVGTGFRIAENKVVTCLHVVAFGNPISSQDNLPDKVHCEFRLSNKSSITIPAVISEYNVNDDWAVLTLPQERLADIKTIHIWSQADATPQHTEWQTHGFPEDITNEGGIACGGRIRSIGDIHEFELWPEEPTVLSNVITARGEEVSNDLDPSGMSGGPMVVGRRVVGIIRAFAPRDHNSKGARGGILYATPIKAVVPIQKTGIEARQSGSHFRTGLTVTALCAILFTWQKCSASSELDNLRTPSNISPSTAPAASARLNNLPSQSRQAEARPQDAKLSEKRLSKSPPESTIVARGHVNSRDRRENRPLIKKKAAHARSKSSKNIGLCPESIRKRTQQCMLSPENSLGIRPKRISDAEVILESCNSASVVWSPNIDKGQSASIEEATVRCALSQCYGDISPCRINLKLGI